MNTIKLLVSRSKGYEGMNRKYAKGYIAHITGTHDEYGYARTFLPSTTDSDEPFRKSKCQWNDVYEITQPGLYERSEGGEKQGFMVFVKAEKLTWVEIPASRAKTIAQMLDDGMDFDAAKLATKPVTA